MSGKDVTVQIAFPMDDIRIWNRLIVGLRFENRFSIDSDTEKFVSNLLKYASEHKTIELQSGKNLYRARLHDLNVTEPFALDNMGAPPRGKTGHGRLNPSGIPYLYLSSDRITAISELRPWIGANATVATFELSADIVLVNFSNKYRVNTPDDADLKGAETMWRELITWMYSAPFDPRDDTSYVPTQFIAERIKAEGYGGVLYDSPMSEDGFNVALFDSEVANCISVNKARVRGVKLEAELRDAGES